jgi:hypothetical protein
MNHHTTQPTVETWILPGGNVLLSAIEEDGESTITLTATVKGEADDPRIALLKLVCALTQAKEAAHEYEAL